MGRRFFGLTPNDKEVYLEETFLLMYYMGFTYQECYDLAIYKRRWFINRLNEEIKKAQGASRGAASNDSGTRTLQGRQRSQVPAKLRRFT